MAKPLNWLKRLLFIGLGLFIINHSIKAQTKTNILAKSPYQNLNNIELIATYNNQTITDTTDFNGNASFTFEKPNAVDDIVNKLYTYKLEQNYPNPFNPSTRIKTTVLKKSKFTIYNVAGQEINSLGLEAGEYELEWNPNVAAGIYYYRISNDEFSLTKGLALLGHGSGSGLTIIKYQSLLAGIPRSLPRNTTNKLHLIARPLNKLHKQIYNNVEQDYTINENQENDVTVNFNTNSNAKLVNGKVKFYDTNKIGATTPLDLETKIDAFLISNDLINYVKINQDSTFTIPFVNNIDSAYVLISDGLTSFSSNAKWYNFIDKVNLNDMIDAYTFERKVYDTIEPIIKNNVITGFRNIKADLLEFIKHMTQTDEKKTHNGIYRGPLLVRWMWPDEYKKWFNEEPGIGCLPFRIYYDDITLSTQGKIVTQKITEQLGLSIEESTSYDKSNVGVTFISSGGIWTILEEEKIYLDGVLYKTPKNVVIKVGRGGDKTIRDTYVHEFGGHNLWVSGHSYLWETQIRGSPYFDSAVPLDTLSIIEQDGLKEIYKIPIFTDMTKVTWDTTLSKQAYDQYAKTDNITLKKYTDNLNKDLDLSLYDYLGKVYNKEIRNKDIEKY